MKKIFICSRLRATEKRSMETHQLFARVYARYVLDHGYGAPFVPHLLYPLFLDDLNDDDRRMGMNAGMTYLDSSDECFVFLDETHTVSEGMRFEILRASAKQIPIRIFLCEQGEINPYDTPFLWLNDRVFLDVEPV